MKLLLSSLFLLSLPALAAQKVQADLSSATMKSLNGKLEAEHTAKGIKVTALVNGLKPGSTHGFHIHENGECKGPDYKSAGGHLNPNKGDHSAPEKKSSHLGDLGNLKADANGIAETEVLIPFDKVKDLNGIVGKAVIIHTSADDLKTQPTGNSGDRIACGVIKI